MSFLGPVRQGDLSAARDDNGVCMICDDRIYVGDPVRFEVRRIGQAGRGSGGFGPAHKPRWVHEDCYQDTDVMYVTKKIVRRR